MLVAVVGGNLQGVEAAYLAAKAGWEVCVIDRKANVPASGLCSIFVQCDVSCQEDLDRALKTADLIIPALEDDAALSSLWHWAHNKEIPLAFDPSAYAITSSKLKSEQLFRQNGISVPDTWPQCPFPVIAKPSQGSGSRGIHILSDMAELQMRFPGSLPPEGYILQQFIPGKTYSLEVTGLPGRYRVHQITDLDMDAQFDCKRVGAPTELKWQLVDAFQDLTLALAEALQLNGIMDVEIVVQNDRLYVLEIDARLPSQTPITVLWSTGRNLLQDYASVFVENIGSCGSLASSQRGVFYEHIRVCAGVLEVGGEHIMTGAGPLRIQPDFFDMDEALTNYAPGSTSWVATLISTGVDRHSAWEKRQHGIRQIMKHFKLQAYRDPEPEICPKEPRTNL